MTYIPLSLRDKNNYKIRIIMPQTFCCM